MNELDQNPEKVRQVVPVGTCIFDDESAKLNDSRNSSDDGDNSGDEVECHKEEEEDHTRLEWVAFEGAFCKDKGKTKHPEETKEKDKTSTTNVCFVFFLSQGTFDQNTWSKSTKEGGRKCELDDGAIEDGSDDSEEITANERPVVNDDDASNSK